MKTTLTDISLEHQLADLEEAILSGAKKISLEGLSGSSKAFLLLLLQQRLKRVFVVQCATVNLAERLFNALLFYGRIIFQKANTENISLFTPWEINPFEVAIPHENILGKRLQTLYQLLNHQVSILLVTPTAAMQRLIPRNILQESCLSLKLRDEVDREILKIMLFEGGYKSRPMVENPAEFSVRGGIIDVWDASQDLPIRIELFGDSIDSLRRFNPGDQRSLTHLKECLILPASELVLNSNSLQNLKNAIKTAALDGFILPSVKNKVNDFKIDSKSAPDLESSESKEDSSTKPDRFGDIPQDILDSLETLASYEPISGLSFLQPFAYSKMETIYDYLADDYLTFIDEPEEIHKVIENFENRIRREVRFWQNSKRKILIPNPDQIYLSKGEILHQLEKPSPIYLKELALLNDNPNQVSFDFGVQNLPSFFGKIPHIAASIKTRGTKDTILVCSSQGQAERLTELLEIESVYLAPWSKESKIRVSTLKDKKEKYDPEADRITLIPGQLLWVVGELSAGFSSDLFGLQVLTVRELFGERKKHRPSRTYKSDQFISSFADLNLYDYVVHVDHGVARYLGLDKVKQKSQTANSTDCYEDFLVLEYFAGDRLYIPARDIKALLRYFIGDDNAPKLDKLGSTTWLKIKSKVKASIRELAQDLLHLYAKRSMLGKGFSFSSDDHFMTEFEAAFEYEETPDQINTIEEVKTDMCSEKIMDRLVCGDVGYGKTEVAMRAAFKAVSDGKQVAILVPTTVLAQQHGQTFQQRFNGYPIKIEMLSRFRTAKEQKEIIQTLKAGALDIVIGTHRLLSKDVSFKNLGLVIVDEEQRFGVAHKEKLKKMRTEVDVLTLTATPIPRTLHMTLMGIRDISIINTPPQDRLSIKTQVMKFSKEVIIKAIRRELARGGQIYFVHNRVRSIERVALLVRELVPEARVIVAHGQMPETVLEKVMLKFLDHQYDVLVCTTIIENGIDIPSVNTIIVNRADKFGLAQLYQLRGRVGRSHHRAYAYLFIPPARVLNPLARKRLRVIQELSELGSGFRLAAHDLEIRGSGNILGAQQHGHITALGFDLYCQLMEEAVNELKGKSIQKQLPATIDLAVNAHLPEDYIPDMQQRLIIYKKISALAEINDLGDLREELLDRYGPLPLSVENLLAIAAIKLKANSLPIKSIKLVSGNLLLKFKEDFKIPWHYMQPLIKNYKGKYGLEGANVFSVKPQTDKENEILTFCLHLLSDFKFLKND